jgi:hypothetical protein
MLLNVLLQVLNINNNPCCVIACGTLYIAFLIALMNMFYPNFLGVNWVLAAFICFFSP